MQYDTFLNQVEQRASLDEAEASSAIRATLSNLSMRLSGGEATDLAAQLPPELATFVEPARLRSGESFSLSEFFNRVARDEGVDRRTAEQHARAVLSVLGDAITRGEINDVRSQLPADFKPLLGPGLPDQPSSAASRSRGRSRSAQPVQLAGPVTVADSTLPAGTQESLQQEAPQFVDRSWQQGDWQETGGELF